MKKLVLILIFAFSMSIAFTSCNEKKSDDVDDAVEEVGDEAEDIVD